MKQEEICLITKENIKIKTTNIILYLGWTCCIDNERPTGQKQQLLDGSAVENKGKLILTDIFPSVQKHDI